MKISFLFGAGAEISYGMPTGGKFALGIFRLDSSLAKDDFKKIRSKIDPSTHYATSFLPEDYETRSVGSFGKKVFEDLIKDTIEHNRDRIVEGLNSFDDIATAVVEKFDNQGFNVDSCIEIITGRSPDNISLSRQIYFTEEFKEGNALFGNHYFSSLLTIYRKEDISTDLRKALKNIIVAILQLHIGALGERLSRKLNENLFKKVDDTIDIFDDLGEIFQLDYRTSGVSGLEYLLDMQKPVMDSEEHIIERFAQELLETFFETVLDYKTLIDSYWHYLYCPKVEWNKFCKISIFLFTVRNYIRKQCKDVDITKEGYYGDVKKAIDDNLIKLGTIATTNYTDIIETLTGQSVHFLNGSTEKIYDPYINKIFDESELDNKELHFYVPLMFTQSGTKPMTSIDMSIEYVNVYNSYLDSDVICSVGFGFNSDDEHINGVIRTLVDNGKKLVVIEPKKESMTNVQRAKEIAYRLKVSATKNVSVIYVDRKTRCAENGKNWIKEIINEESQNK